MAFPTPFDTTATREPADGWNVHHKLRRTGKQLFRTIRWKDYLHLHRKWDDRPLLTTATRQGIMTVALPAAPSLTESWSSDKWPAFPVDKAKQHKLIDLINKKLDEAESRGASSEQIEETLREEVFEKVLKSSTTNLTRRVLDTQSDEEVRNISDAILGLQEKLDAQMKLFLQRGAQLLPGLSKRDLKRAATNVWPCLCFQLLCGQEAHLTDAIIGMSLLYPLTDDLVDDPSMSKEAKFSFLHRFGELIATGKSKHNGTKSEQDIWSMFSLIEGDFSRFRFPLIYRSLNDLLTAQGDSLRQAGGPRYDQRIPGFADVWEVTLRKAALSILSDAYLVKGRLTDAEASFVAHFGVLTQYLNDARGLKNDLAEGQYTPLNLAMLDGPASMDNMFGFAISHHYEAFGHKEHLSICRNNPKMLAFMATMCSFLTFKLFEAIAINEESFTPAFLEQVEQVAPLPLGLMRRLWKVQYANNRDAEILPDS